MLKNRIRMAVAVMAVAVLFGCGSAPAAASSHTDTAQQQESGAAGQAPGAQSTVTAGRYEIPPFQSSTFHAEQAAGEGGVQIDLSAVSEGYVAVCAESESKLKFRVIFGDSTYTYDLPGDGTPTAYPLQSGDGSYDFQVWTNISADQYAILYKTQADVKLKSEFEPFLRPSQFVNYGEGSACVARVRELAQSCDSDAELVNAVYAYLCKQIRYDYGKAKTVESGYLPNPDETLSTGYGICFDYAALAASMLRSAGVPTKMIFGYVGDIYHAWNAIYLEGQGWITVEIKASTEQWQRIDITFAATGADTEFLTDDGNYITRYIY